MSVEKALVEEREGFFTGGRSRRGGLRGGRRSSKRSSPGPKKRGRGGPKNQNLHKDNPVLINLRLKNQHLHKDNPVLR